jgi:hypothetical protein
VDPSRIHVRDFYALGVFAVTMPLHAAPRAKMFWQHTGEVVSSRLAAAVLRIVDRTCYENLKGAAALLPPNSSKSHANNNNNNTNNNSSSSSNNNNNAAAAATATGTANAGEDANDDGYGGATDQLDRSATHALVERVAAVAGVHRSSVFLCVREFA